jgi:cytochrome b involved in lipid metabolism
VNKRRGTTTLEAFDEASSVRPRARDRLVRARPPAARARPPLHPLARARSAAINLSEVESHAAKDDCWLSIEGKVFDVTSWMPKHPGGAAILFRQCGKVAARPIVPAQHSRSSDRSADVTGR